MLIFTYICLTCISTHSPRVGRTLLMYAFLAQNTKISTHSPRVGRTLNRWNVNLNIDHFNSLAPCGANLSDVIKYVLSHKISTHSPRVGRTKEGMLATAHHTNFNSLAPCGANRRRACRCGYAEKFQLTRPVWGEPILCACDAVIVPISTHSPRVGRTYLRPPYSLRGRAFQLTRPVWGEPSRGGTFSALNGISTHSPRVGRTWSYYSTV